VPGLTDTRVGKVSRDLEEPEEVSGRDVATKFDVIPSALHDSNRFS
jgi:hypothetical protein